MFLVSSIITINIIKAAGVPCGTRCANIWFVFLNHPNRTMDSQNSNDKGRVTVKWEVGENTWGYKAKKFSIKIDVNAVIIKISVLFSFFPKENLTSLLNISMTFLLAKAIEFETFHIIILMKSGDKNKINQEDEKIEEEGSNTENKFIIILSCFLFFWIIV
jgi:hypothetical protein